MYYLCIFHNREYLNIDNIDNIDSSSTIKISLETSVKGSQKKSKDIN